MSLADPNDDYNELIPAGSGRVRKLLNKAKFYAVILVIGIIIGAYLQYAYFNPIVYNVSTSPCNDCIRTKELLDKENSCLYSLLGDPHSASLQCANNLNTNNVVDDNTQPAPNLPAIDSNTGDTNIPKGF